MVKKTFIIWSIDRHMWKSHEGYTEFREEAKEYDFEEATAVTNLANYQLADEPVEAMIEWHDMTRALKEADDQG